MRQYFLPITGRPVGPGGKFLLSNIFHIIAAIPTTAKQVITIAIMMKNIKIIICYFSDDTYNFCHVSDLSNCYSFCHVSYLSSNCYTR